MSITRTIIATIAALAISCGAAFTIAALAAAAGVAAAAINTTQEASK